MAKKSIKKKQTIIDDNRGQWAHPGKVTRIDSNNITMKGVPYPVLGVGADGEQRMMYPNEEHTFNQAPVTEYPMMQAKDGGWINKYAEGGKAAELEYLNSLSSKDLASNPRIAEINRQRQKLENKNKEIEFSDSLEKESLLEKLKEFSTKFSNKENEEDDNRDDGYDYSSNDKPKEVVKNNYIYVNPGDKVNTSTQVDLPKVKPVNAVDDGIFLAFADAVAEYKELYPGSPIPKISSGIRTRAEQERLYANRKNNPYPVAKPGTSTHELGQALDIVFTGGGSDLDYQRLEALMKPRGFKWLGNYDRVHFQIDPNYPKTTISENGNILMTGQKPSTTLDVNHPKPRAFQDGGYLTQYQDGSTVSADDEKYAKFVQTLPDNLKNNDDRYYNLRGYWESLGKPEAFDYSQPKEEDGYYHAFSRNPNTGEILKKPGHPTFKYALEEDAKEGYNAYISPDGTVYTFGKDDVVPEGFKPYEYKRGGVTWLNEYQTGGETFQYYTLPNGKKVRVEYTEEGVSHYDPVTETIIFNPNNDSDNPEAVLQHEGMHAWQDENGEFHIDTPESFGPLKRPNMAQADTSDEVLNYFNRRPLDESYVAKDVLQRNPEFGFVPYELLYNGHGGFPGVNELMYENPNTAEGQARDYEYAYRRGQVGRPVIVSEYKDGGKTFSAGGEKHKVYKKESPTGNGKGVKGHIMVTHPTKDKGKWDTIDLTEKSGAKTVAQGVAATRKWHRENPEYATGGPFLPGMNPLMPSTYMTPRQLKQVSEVMTDIISFLPGGAGIGYTAGLPFTATDLADDYSRGASTSETAADAVGLIPGIKYVKHLPGSGLKKAATVIKDLKAVNNLINLFNLGKDMHDLTTPEKQTLPPGTMLPQVTITPKKQNGGWLNNYK